jgi:hypothetical protein
MVSSKNPKADVSDSRRKGKRRQRETVPLEKFKVFDGRAG